RRPACQYAPTPRTAGAGPGRGGAGSRCPVDSSADHATIRRCSGERPQIARRRTMSVDTPTLFSQVIQAHLALKERNSELDHELPLDRYKDEDPFDNHPLFKNEEHARIADTMDGTEPAIPAAPTIALKWPGEEDDEEPAAVEAHDGLWTPSRDITVGGRNT